MNKEIKKLYLYTHYRQRMEKQTRFLFNRMDKELNFKTNLKLRRNKTCQDSDNLTWYIKEPVDIFLMISGGWKLINPSKFAPYQKQNMATTLHKSWSFPLKISSVNVTKPQFWSHLLKKPLMKNFSFCAVRSLSRLSSCKL